MMKSRSLLVVRESESFTVLAPSASTSLGDKGFLTVSFNQSSVFSAFPNFSLFDKRNNETSPAVNSYGNPYDLNARFNPTMAVIIVVLLSAFFFMGFFSIYVRNCGGEEDTGGNSRRGGGGNGRMNRASQGIDRSIIETFPVFNYSLVKRLKQGKQALECAVCLSEFEDDETLRLLPKCGHSFHPDCIDMWLFSHTTCPLCRCGLLPESNSVGQGLSVDVESQPQQGPLPLHPPEQVVIVVEAATAVQDRVDHQGRGTNGLNPFDAGVPRTSPGQARDYHEHGASATDSPILGVINGLRPLENRSQNFKRSHSTGHSLVRLGGNPQHPSEFYISTNDRYVLDSAEGLLESPKAGFHRSNSYAAFCYSGSPGFSNSEAFVNDRERLWRYPSSTESAGLQGACARCNPHSSRGAEVETEQEFARLSETRFDPRINSDRWSVSLHSPIFTRTFSESRAPYFQQQEMTTTSSTSHESVSQDLKAYLLSFKSGLKWLQGRDKNMASNNGSEASRSAEQGGPHAYNSLT